MFPSRRLLLFLFSCFFFTFSPFPAFPPLFLISFESSRFHAKCVWPLTKHTSHVRTMYLSKMIGKCLHIYMYIHTCTFLYFRSDRKEYAIFVQPILRLSTLHHAHTHTTVPAFVPFFSLIGAVSVPQYEYIYVYIYIYMRVCACARACVWTFCARYAHVYTYTNTISRSLFHRNPHRYQPHQPRLFTISFAWSLTRRSSRNWIKSFFQPKALNEGVGFASIRVRWLKGEGRRKRKKGQIPYYTTATRV